jgi:hypothetical protein
MCGAIMIVGGLTRSASLSELEPGLLCWGSLWMSQKGWAELWLEAEWEGCEGCEPRASSSPSRVQMGGRAWRAQLLFPRFHPMVDLGYGEMTWRSNWVLRRGVCTMWTLSREGVIKGTWTPALMGEREDKLIGRRSCRTTVTEGGDAPRQ